MTPLMLEALELRRLLSVSLSESEPNNSRATADVIARLPGTEVLVSGRIGSQGDHDWFKIQLKPGDVIGAATTAVGALDSSLQLLNSSGDVLFALDDSVHSGSNVLPDESPLPRTRGSDLDAELWYVISTPGAYYIKVSASDLAASGAEVGQYEMDLLVARPGLESQAVGTRQILFLDFNGANVDYDHFSDIGLPDKVKLSPMSSFLGDWALSAADENALIDAVVARVTEILSTDVRQRGLNGDYDSTGRPGDFDLEIRNSRDHRDTFGKDPFVSRVVIGGTQAEAGFVGDLSFIDGLAETIDIGNFKTDDQAVATLDWITRGINLGASAVAPLTQVDLIAAAVTALTVHEVGHFFGCIHTDQSAADIFAGTPNVMDPNIPAFIGPDFILGTADDQDRRLGVDSYNADDTIFGRNDTLNTVAFGLSTGRGAASASAPAGIASSGILATSGSLFGTTAISSRSRFAALENEEEELAVL